jgi:DNA-directed RNA polymerase subunit D
MINSVACFAIDSVTLYENSSTMFDEYISHRVGMVPILTPKGYDEKDEILFTLDSEGPGIILSKELKSTDKGVKVANDNIPIIKLSEGQKLRLDGKAILRTTKKSAKFQAGLITYKAINDKEFDFYVESFGQMPPTEILERALNIISSNVKEVYKELKK